MEQPPAALPRALDVQRFAGAREQEIRALCAALKGSQLGAKFGVAALPRHLRRRAGSHKPYHGHRFRANAKLQGKRRKLNPETEAAGVGGADGDGSEADAAASSTRPFTNRRMRRHPALLKQQHRQSAAWTEASLASSAGDAAAGSSVAGSAGSGASVRRLETHVWHAKRLAMEERYGWMLPAGAAGQGRGSRSFVHVTKASSLMHDASYLCPLLLRGTWSGVHAVLSAMLEPAASAALDSDWTSMTSDSDGSSSSRLGWEQDFMLYSPGQYPLGAICPAHLLISPSGSGSGVQAMEAEGGEPGGAASPAAWQLFGNSRSSSDSTVQACLWIHPAAAAEAHTALQQAVARVAPAGGDSQVSIAVLNMRRLEIRGGAADRALAVALAGATAASSSSHDGSLADSQPEPQPRQQMSTVALGRQQQVQQQQQAQQQQAVPLPPVLAAMQHADVVQLLLPDPRLQKAVVVGGAAASLLQENPVLSSSAESLQRPLQQLPLDLCPLLQAPLPLSEAELSAARQQLQRRMLHLGEGPAGGAAASSAAGGAPQLQPTQRQQQAQVQRRGYCPALLVRHDPPQDAGVPGWSLVLPAGWVPPFWLAAAYAGCKPAGQREWRWLHTLQQRLSFPWDFPDTPAYTALMREQHLQRGVAQARRPKGKQMLSAPPCLPPWDELVGQLRSSSGTGQAAEPQQGQVKQQEQAQPPSQPEQQQGQQQQQPMEVDAALPAAAQPASTAAEDATATPAATAAPPPPAIAAAEGGVSQLYVARSYSAMAAALHSSSGAEAAGLPTGTRRPVAVALRQGLLQWRPRQQQQPAPAPAPPRSTGSCSSTAGGGGSCCLLEASVQPIKTGTVVEGAAVCLLAGREAVRQRTPLQVLSAKQQRRREREAEQAAAALAEVGGDPAEAVAAGPTGSSSSSSSTDVPAEAVHVIGYVLTEAPRGAPRRCGSLAAVAAAPAWRLRALQHWAPRQDGGAIEAFVRNPGSTTLYPVRLRLLAEQQV